MSQTQTENEKRKKKIIVAAIGVFMIAAAVGIGFAVIYTGTVDNTSNDADDRYYIVSIDADRDGTYDEASDFTDMFTGSVYFDTVNRSTGVTFTAHDMVTIDGSTCVCLGTVNVKVHGPEGLESYDDYDLSINHGSSFSDSYKIVIEYDGSTVEDDYSSTANDGYTMSCTGAEEMIYTVSLYVVVTSPTATEPEPYLYSGETFTITAEATA